MQPTAQRGVVWGVASSLLFVVLVLGYRLAVGVGVSPTVTVVVALVVGAVTGSLSYAIDARLG